MIHIHISTYFSNCLDSTKSFGEDRRGAIGIHDPEIFVGEMAGGEIARHVVSDHDPLSQLGVPSVPSSSSEGVGKRATAIATYFNMMPRSTLQFEGQTVHVEFLACFSGGNFARILDAKNTSVLGLIKSTSDVFSSPSLNADCRVHKPMQSCKCWVTCRTQDAKVAVFQDLVKWIAQGAMQDKPAHIDSSSVVRSRHGMKIRNSKKT